MTKIIDLDFYRKFRIVLPVRSRTLAKNKKSYMNPRLSIKPYRRRQRADSDSKVTKEE